ncbi:hypothetical protein [Brachyspira pilosicoli]|uniref:DUF3383 domain-containing protein n=1 Tax=Brachyspira pilosicoli TaxID=52584 RepID=A0AAJ6KCY6_BRAPL|nr:hypothetical protein [Brachyspira pilosicoli]WIH89356.1 hypothetical protein NEI02_06510 [Brachyspira pilosicoli]WIH91651.1 hypothetical protein NEI01_06510 [Brachyspira pilosicoli]WIH94537.1 hypothetical protein NEH99_09590 [Brachyspira pilosicoli]SUV99499.1 Uncharacterised protein [Brachyspira pilosicoli]SUW00974.1 Uncharacterised protein [Brachyspira pilosicoli]
MARPNPLQPVIVNVKTLGVNVPENYTRVFGIVSYGDTNLEAGTLKTISKSDVADLELKEGSYTESFLNSFFTNNAMGQINVLETRTVPNIKQYVVGDYYVDGSQAYKCLQADTATSETDLKPIKLSEVSYWEETSDPKNYEVDDLYVNTQGETYKCIQADVAVSSTNLTPTNLSETTYWTNITSEIVSQAVKVLSDFVASGELRVYEWACPTSFYDNTDFIALVKSYSGITAGQYFSLELPEGTDPSTDETFALYIQSKSFAPVYPSLVKGESSNGAIVGIKAGNLYNLSVSNPLSLLQWKTVYGITPRDRLSNSLVDALNENGCSWIGSLNNNTVVLGGMVADGQNWESYFALDTFIFRLTVDIASMMIQASNNPLQSISFNQNGINIIKNKLVAISNTMLSFGVLDNFGSDYDTNTNAILNTGEWSAIDFATYKANQYQDWKDGIYNGASCYVTIRHFVLQIVPSITKE